MKRILIALVVIIVVFSSSCSADIVEIGLGCAASFMLHEAGHYVVGNSVGELEFVRGDDWFGLPDWVYYGNKEGLAKTGVAGFQTDWLLREYCLQKRPEGDFWKAFFWHNILHHAIYCFCDEGDVNAIYEGAGVSKGTTHTFLAVLLLADIYRYFHPKENGLDVILAPKVVGLGWSVSF